MAEGSFSGLRPLQGGATQSRTSVMGDEAAGLLDLVARRQFPARHAGWEDVVKALTERAKGSPNALEGLVSPKLQEMAQRIMQSNDRLSRTFGPYGGKQTPGRDGTGTGGARPPRHLRQRGDRCRAKAQRLCRVGRP